MSGIRDLEENIARLEAASERAERAAREANAATKALEQKRKELRYLIDQTVDDVLQEAVVPIVSKGLHDLELQFRDATKQTHARVLEQVDVLLNAAIGRPGKVKGKDVDLRPQLIELIRTFVLDEVRKAGEL